MDDSSASAPVPAGDRPTNRQPPVSSLEDFKGKVLSEARNQYSCEFLNQKLQERKPEDIQIIFSEVKAHVGMLMMDGFGSNVIQKLFPVCDHEQMDQLVFSVTADVRLLMAICLDSLGSQSMWKLIDCLTTEKQLVNVISAFRKIIVPLVTHPIGSSVIRHYYHVFHGAQVESILAAIAENFMVIATSESGSCLLQVFISDDFSLMGHRRILSGIMLFICDLSRNQFGSHLVQHLIGLGIEDVLVGMVEDLRGRYVTLSKDKYASNVVKKLMKATKETYAPEIINEIISSPNFLSVLQNPYGYDVIQSAKEYSTGTVCETLNHLIRQHSEHLHGQGPGKNALPNKKNHVLLNKKRKRNHVLLIKNHVLLNKKRKRNHV